MTPIDPSPPSDSQSSGARRASIGRRLWQFASVLFLVVIAATCLVFVDEREAVIVERFGNIAAVYDRPSDCGAHVKFPWPIDLVRRFDRRVQFYNPPAREMFTSDKKNVTVDAYVCWKVPAPSDGQSTSSQERPVVRFYRGLGNKNLAEVRLETRLRSILATAIGQVELNQLLAVRNSEQGPGKEDAGPLERLSDAVRREMTQRANEGKSLTDRLGIEIVDLRITRLNLPAGNQQAVFDRMKSERKKIADRYRSAGLADNQMIKSQADRQYSEILAKARADAERIRGASEAEAVRILNAAHAQDPEFYSLLATLDAYRKILNDKTTIVLSASSKLLRLLTDGIPELKEPLRSPSGSAQSSPAKPTTAADKTSKVARGMQ